MQAHTDTAAAFRPKFDDVVHGITRKIRSYWSVMNGAATFSIDYMDHDGIPQIAVFDRNALHAAEQLWAEKEGL